ncbi:hypothetical protein HGRIS_000414 [Hohenbuehelia grisea]|uniref:Uncharacterized protein n=1 Tax=Hohenbuehelia grisea TaxID=104357 RepID=A0ABR3JR57_9AGAR
MAFTALVWLASAVTSIAVAVLETSQAVVIPRFPGLPIPGCLATVPPNAHLSLIPTIVASVSTLIYFLLTFYKFLQVVRTHGLSKYQNLKGFKKLAPTIHLFFRDSALYLMLALVINALNMVFFIALRHRALEQMSNAWLMAAYAIISSRMVLNLSDANYGNQSFQQTEASALEFASGSRNAQSIFDDYL